MFVRLLLMVALLFGGCGAKSAKPDASPGWGKPGSQIQDLHDPQFFVALKDEAGEWKFETGDRVPLLPGRSMYGWVAEVNSDASVQVTETLSLPGRPQRFPSTMTLSPDGRTLTGSRTLQPLDGHVVGIWVVGEGDPVGEHTLTISAGRTRHTFRFTVVPTS